jgi:hypothetical protein
MGDLRIAAPGQRCPCNDDGKYRKRKTKHEPEKLIRGWRKFNLNWASIRAKCNRGDRLKKCGGKRQTRKSGFRNEIHSEFRYGLEVEERGTRFSVGKKCGGTRQARKSGFRNEILSEFRYGLGEEERGTRFSVGGDAHSASLPPRSQNTRKF